MHPFLLLSWSLLISNTPKLQTKSREILINSMGIFGFYSWLRGKCPKIAVNAIQEPTSDATSPNPNGLEFDNLYLDMNGIIHPCFHPDGLDDLQPTSFEEVFNSVFEYVDRLFNIVRPRKLLYFAIDGVAPMAKMDLIRKGRYQNARISEISKQEEDRLRSQYARKGKQLLPKAESQVDDPNIITPGTEFLYEFCKALQGYIQTRLRENPAWKNLKVILSDANVPGEGEHKIVCFMRSQRSLPGYDVNTRHCIHGLDADLIMLALATHELHTSILREVRDYGDSPRPSGSCKPFPVRRSFSYEFVHIWIIKEYLELDMQPSDAPEGCKFDVERAVDDFVFICFFLGNDFLPCLPSLIVREGALDLLMTVYKREFKSLGGYLVDAERVHEPNGAYLDLERVEKFVLSLGSYEDQIFEKRTELQEREMKRVLRELLASVSTQRNDDARDMEIPIDIPNAENDGIVKNTKQLKEELRKCLHDEADASKTVLVPANEIKYGTEGWKDRYYQKKFEGEDHLELESIKKAVVKEYTEGLCWVLLYYFSGVPSWSWFYPYYYGPCASDMKGLGQLQVEFQEGVPLEPFEMLMSVLPSRSAEALPRAYRKLYFWSKIRCAYTKLMKDDISDLMPFYSRAMAKEEITEYEAQRNSLSSDLLFVRALSDFGSQLLSKIVEDQSAVDGVGGFVNLISHALDSSNGEDGILCVQFGLPKPSTQAPLILDNVDIPQRTVYEFDIKETTLWHEQRGGNRFHRAPNQSRYPGPQENEPSRLAGSGWRGRGSESSGLPSSNSREGLYNHPNRSKSFGNSDRSSSSVNDRALFRPQRPMPNEISGTSREVVYNHPNCPKSIGNSSSSSSSPCALSSGENAINSNQSLSPVEYSGLFRPQRPMPAPPRSHNSENNTWPSARFASTSQMVGQYENLSVSSTREGRGSGRERYAHATDNQGSRGGRGRGQFWRSRDSGSSEHW